MSRSSNEQQNIFTDQFTSFSLSSVWYCGLAYYLSRVFHTFNRWLFIWCESLYPPLSRSLLSFLLEFKSALFWFITVFQFSNFSSRTLGTISRASSSSSCSTVFHLIKVLWFLQLNIRYDHLIRIEWKLERPWLKIEILLTANQQRVLNGWNENTIMAADVI